jgi:3-isopropylmalate dehydratase small subunit
MKLKGRVWKFGDNINTDLIYPGRYMAILDPKETAQHAFETVHPDFVSLVKPGDLVVAGRYFGCGSSREQAATCLKYLGIGGVIAESFARIYYRNAINLGLPIVVCPGVSSKVEPGQALEVELESGALRNLSTGAVLSFPPLPDFILEILSDGGLIPHIKKRLKKGEGKL